MQSLKARAPVLFLKIDEATICPVGDPDRMWISNWLGREITWPPSPLVNISRDERARRVEKIGMAPTQLLITATSPFIVTPGYHPGKAK